MTYAPTYTTAALVQKRLQQIDVTLVAGDIEAFIDEAEGMIDAVMQMTGRGTTKDFTFNADRHGLVRNATESLAAFMCANFDVSNFSSASQAALVCDLLWSEADRGMGMLSLKAIQRYIKTVTA